MIAIISDLHDNLANLDKCLTWCERAAVSALLCCGDVTNEETIGHLAGRFKKDIYLVRGNVCNYDEKILAKYAHIHYLGREGGAIELEGRRIAICHEPFLLDELIRRTAPAIVFYGHTHKPWIEKRNEVMVVNPGTLGGLFQKATFAIYDAAASEPELKILEEL